MSARRLGVFGGTFDPPHNGHVAALRAAWDSGRYGEILVTVANDPYLKSGDRPVSDAALRLAMAHAAFDHLPGVVVSDREIRRGGPTYTIDTVLELRTGHDEIELIIGEDAMGGLDEWRDAPRLRELVTIAVVPRTGDGDRVSNMWHMVRLEMDPVDLSSTQIRELDVNDRRLALLIPEPVMALWRRTPRVH